VFRKSVDTDGMESKDGKKPIIIKIAIHSHFKLIEVVPFTIVQLKTCEMQSFQKAFMYSGVSLQGEIVSHVDFAHVQVGHINSPLRPREICLV